MSGLGVVKAKKATLFLLQAFTIMQSDTFLNIGICGASKEHPIGSLLEIGALQYNNIHYILHSPTTYTITCLDEEATENEHNIVDMESYGFYEAVKGMKNAYIFKVVSDHFEPHTVTKERTKNLLFRQIDEIIKRVNR